MPHEETWTRMRELAARYPDARSAMLPCLHLVQGDEGYVSPEGIAAVAGVIGVKPDEVESVVTFYSMYHQAPLGRSVIKVCTSISCYLRGCDTLMAHVEQRLGIRRGETTPDRRFTLEGVECLAACGMAPVLQVNGAFVENVTTALADTLLDRLDRGEGIGDLASQWRPIGNGGYTSVAVGADQSGAPQRPQRHPPQRPEAKRVSHNATDTDPKAKKAR